MHGRAGSSTDDEHGRLGLYAMEGRPRLAGLQDKCGSALREAILLHSRFSVQVSTQGGVTSVIKGLGTSSEWGSDPALICWVVHCNIAITVEVPFV